MINGKGYTHRLDNQFSKFINLHHDINESHRDAIFQYIRFSGSSCGNRCRSFMAFHKSNQGIK